MAGEEKGDEGKTTGSCKFLGQNDDWRSTNSRLYYI